jgi:hypothetical protein
MKKFMTFASLAFTLSASGAALAPSVWANDHKGEHKACKCDDGACKECGEGKCECKDNCACEGKCDCAEGSKKDKKAKAKKTG